jgi:hypothetical protein
VGRLALSCDELLVVVGAQEAFYIISVGWLDLHDPALAIGIAIDELRAIFEVRVDFEDLTFEREEEIRDGLDRFDGAKDFLSAEAFSFGVDIDEYDLSELTLSVVRDTYVDDITFETSPFVILGVP